MDKERINEIAEVVEAINQKKKEREKEKEIEIEFNKNMNFEEWFLYHHNREKGLINQKTVSNILQLSTTRIMQFKNNGKLKVFKYPKDTQKYYSLKEVLKILEFYKYKRTYL